MKITVPDIAGDDTRPAGTCWKASPVNLWRCTKPAGHDGKHTWEQTMNALLIIWLAAHGCDATTTHLALSRGGVERNPFYTQSPIANNVLMASEAAAVLFVTRKYGPSHPKLAKVILVAGIGLSGYAAVHNIQTLRIQNRSR